MYDEEKAQRAVNFVKLLRNTQGEYAKHPFNLMPFQEKIIKDIFGTVNDEGYREIREAFIFLPRKNGKTELIAALVLYCLFMDDEYGAEIYSAATSREQAMDLGQVFRHIFLRIFINYSSFAGAVDINIKENL